MQELNVAIVYYIAIAYYSEDNSINNCMALLFGNCNCMAIYIIMQIICLVMISLLQ